MLKARLLICANNGDPSTRSMSSRILLDMSGSNLEDKSLQKVQKQQSVNSTIKCMAIEQFQLILLVKKFIMIMIK